MKERRKGGGKRRKNNKKKNTFYIRVECSKFKVCDKHSSFFAYGVIQHSKMFIVIVPIHSIN